ncbi:hypothetical protein V8D89_014725 [Ganoderma adspersum]
MADPTTRPLPPELEFIIIDHLFSHKPALASCSLVCSRWLPPSRRHLFRHITIKPAMRLNPSPLETFLRILQDSGEVYPEWAIGPCIENLALDGSILKDPRLTPTLTCSLSLLRRLLSNLPRLASLCLRYLLMSDDLVEESGAQHAGRLDFKLDDLIVYGCTAEGHDPHHFLVLICMFSSIDSLVVTRWGRFMPQFVSSFSSSVLSPPIVRSLEINWTDEPVPPAIYALLTDSPSVANGHLTRMSLDTLSRSELHRFSNFARVAGAAFHEVVLRANSQLFDPSEMLGSVSLETCTALRSLVLSMELTLDDDNASGGLHADDTREVFSAYTEFFRRHRDTFSLLTTIRFEVQPVGQWMLDAFVRVAQDTFPECVGRMTQTVSAEEAEHNRRLWESLEDVLSGFPVLERVEFVLYDMDREALTEEAKDQLRHALEGRLPRLWPSGVAQLVFETFVNHPL